MTTMTTRKEQKVITGTERLASSVNGNPRYRVTFADGTDARTGVDSGIAYGITNSDLRGGPVEVTFDGRGNIIDARPVNEPWSDEEAAKLASLARQVLAGDAFHKRGHDGYGADVLTRENCGACVLAGYEDPSGEQTVDRDGPNYAGWARLYVEARRPIPERWRQAFDRELHSDNAAYSAALARDIATFGVSYE